MSEQTPETPAAAPLDPAALQAELAETKDRLLRALAEGENIRKRLEREKGDALTYGIARFAGDLLPVADNLRRALDAVPAESRADLPEPVQNLLVGIAATERGLLATFERHGIKPVNPVGAKFNPQFHEAIGEVQGSGQAPGTVVAVAQIGYTIGERPLRAAMVTVAKGDVAPGATVNTTA